MSRGADWTPALGRASPGGCGRTQRQHGPGGTQRLTRGNIQTQWIGQCTLGFTRGPQGSQLPPHWGSTCRRVSTSGGTWGQREVAKLKGRPQKQLLVEGATGLWHRPGEGAEGSKALREPVERGLSQGLGDQNQKLGGYLLFEGDS